MSKKIILIVLFAFVSLGLYSQRPTLELTFTAENNGLYVQLDRIKVMNRTQGGETVLYWPDTTITLEITPGDELLYIGYSTDFPWGTEEIYPALEQFTVFQSNPNPVKDQGIISMFIPEKGTVDVIATDVQGRLVISSARQLDKGNHSFRFTPGAANLYFLTARWKGESRCIKILTIEPKTWKRCRLDYAGSNNGEASLKATSFKRDLTMQESGILDAPSQSETYTFQFATNIPCPGIPTVEYEGQVYNTIQFFSQCWLKENLNVGEMIPGTIEQLNNGTIEKYCYNNEPDSCTKYGGLYQWWEMMQYTTQQGTQGICPPGWHLPTDEEWKLLEGAADSQYGIGDPEWDISNYRGFDAGTNLKTTSGWYENGNGTDLFGWSGLPGGYRDGGGNFYGVGDGGIWWASTVNDGISAWVRGLIYSDPGVFREFWLENYSFRVRCLRE